MRRGDIRIARSRAHVGSLRAETTAWFDEREGDARYARFAAHLDTLRAFIERLLDAIDGRLETLAEQPSGDVYERCRAAEQSLTIVRRIFAWYAEKYAQREHALTAATLLAADEIIRSCWTEPFAALGRQPPSGPLAYLEPRFDAFATPRVSLPPDLRAPGDELIGEMVRELPIPTIAMPVSCPDEPWWLVLAAHETGHHVQKDLQPGLENATRDALEQAVSALPGGDELASDWRRWALESFADAFSVAMVGPAAVWAVDELQHAGLDRLLRAPSSDDRYPPPVVRLALLGELCGRLGLASDTTYSADVLLAWLHSLSADSQTNAGRAAAELHLGVTPAVAQALLELPIGSRTLVQVCGWDGQRFAEKGVVAAWAAQLATRSPVLTQRANRWAARVAVSSGVSAYQQAVAKGLAGREFEQRMGQNLIGVLATCGEPGVLAAAGQAGDGAAVADRFADRLPDVAGGDD